MLKILVKTMVYTHLSKLDPLFTLKTLCIKCFVNQKIDWLQKIKTVLFMKLTSNWKAVYFGESKLSLKLR